MPRRHVLSAPLRQETIGALGQVARLTSADQPGGFDQAFTSWASHYGLVVEEPDFAARLFALIAKRVAIARGERREDVSAEFRPNERAAAAYAFFEAVKNLPQREPIEADLEEYVSASRFKAGPNSLLHVCLRAFMQYKPPPPTSRTSPSQFWYRHGLALRYAMRMNILPSQLAATARQAGQSVNGWARQQAEFERQGVVVPQAPTLSAVQLQKPLLAASSGYALAIVKGADTTAGVRVMESAPIKDENAMMLVRSVLTFLASQPPNDT